MKPTSRFFAVATLAAVVFAGCNGGDDEKQIDYFEALRNNPDANRNAWYSATAELCGEGEPRPGCNFRYDGNKINLAADPYRSDLQIQLTRSPYTDSYVSTDRVWDSCASGSWPDNCVGGYVTETSVNTFTNYNIFLITPDGRVFSSRDWGLNARFYSDALKGWNIEPVVNSRVNDLRITSPTGVQYNYEGRALNSVLLAGGSEDGDDLLGSVSEQKEDQVKGFAEVLSSKFQLEADVAEKAARALSDWSDIGSRRARTAADFAAFSKNVYGIEMKQVDDVILLAKKGELAKAQAKADSLVGQAAKNWKTSPETMKEVLKFFYGNYLN
jgi:hypothetical protein